MHNTERPGEWTIHYKSQRRAGAVLPFIAVMLPVLLVLCAFAINIAYMQLTRTELKIATDAAARAGGRAWSETQSVDQAKTFARDAAAANLVAGEPLLISTNNKDNEIEFGMSERAGSGRFQFTKKNTAQVINGTADANSIRVVGRRTGGSLSGPVTLLIGGVGTTRNFTPQRTSICTQLDRDVALVLDRSGSMAYSGDDYLIFEMMEDLLDAELISEDEFNDALSGIEDDAVQDEYEIGGIIYDRVFSANVLNLIQNDASLQATFTAQELTDVHAYGVGVNDYNANNGPAPPFSRWDVLGDAVDAFFTVFENSPQEEKASLGSFNSSGTLHLNLVDDANGYVEVTNIINGYYDAGGNWVPGLRPEGSTSIGGGMQQTLPALVGDGTNPAPGARPFAAKTIVVMTDGRQNTTPDPQTVAADIVANHNVRIHTVTFTPEADQQTMKEVAAIGNGKHYHGNTPDELIAIFMEIANNLPTTMTE